MRTRSGQQLSLFKLHPTKSLCWCDYAAHKRYPGNSFEKLQLSYRGVGKETKLENRETKGSAPSKHYLGNCFHVHVLSEVWRSAQANEEELLRVMRRGSVGVGGSFDAYFCRSAVVVDPCLLSLQSPAVRWLPGSTGRAMRGRAGQGRRCR